MGCEDEQPTMPRAMSSPSSMRARHSPTIVPLAVGGLGIGRKLERFYKIRAKLGMRKVRPVGGYACSTTSDWLLVQRFLGPFQDRRGHHYGTI